MVRKKVSQEKEYQRLFFPFADLRARAGGPS